MCFSSPRIHSTSPSPFVALYPPLLPSLLTPLSPPLSSPPISPHPLSPPFSSIILLPPCPSLTYITPANSQSRGSREPKSPHSANRDVLSLSTSLSGTLIKSEDHDSTDTEDSDDSSDDKVTCLVSMCDKQAHQI